MKIEQIYTGCLAQGAYYIVSGKDAAIIDPLREINPYLERAVKDGVKIKYIFETHFHADFVSGHIDLAKATGAKIIYGPTASPSFDVHKAVHGEEFKVGELTIKALHTPGHTMESTCFLLKDNTNKDYAVFTGDTLFIGDVGRPDLAQKAAHMTQDDLAGLLFDSLRNNLMTLSDDVIVYPAHGAGSACGKNMSKETVSTIGLQKKFNYALRANMTKDEFIKEVTDGLLPPPSYFPVNVKLNKEGYENIQEVLDRGKTPLSASEFEVVANETSALILDTRNPDLFVKGFVPNSISIGIDGSFAPWVGALVPDVRQELLLITELGREEEVITRLARVGYDHVVGYLNGGFGEWVASGKEVDTINSVSAIEFASTYNESVEIIDVRKSSEFEAEHITSAKNIALDFLNENMSSFNPSTKTYLHCAGGYRSVIAASILKSRGIENIINIEGGFKAIKETAIPCTNFNCASTN